LLYINKAIDRGWHKNYEKVVFVMTVNDCNAPLKLDHQKAILVVRQNQ